MPTSPRSRAEHHFQQAEQTLATLDAVGAEPEDATREATVALVHAVLSIAASLTRHQPPPDDDQTRFESEF